MCTLVETENEGFPEWTHSKGLLDKRYESCIGCIVDCKLLTNWTPDERSESYLDDGYLKVGRHQPFLIIWVSK